MMSGAGGSASSAAAAVMQADRAACVWKGVGLWQVEPASAHCWWLTSAHRGRWAHIYPPVSRRTEKRKACWVFVELQMLSASAGALSGRSPPARLGQGQKIVAGSHNIRTEEGEK